MKNKLALSIKQKSKAFTLIELLVVATIIVILTVIVVVNLEKARAKSRDMQRKADISRIAMAMETYKADMKTYILSGNSGADFSDADGAAGQILVLLVSKNYITTIPTDPNSSTTFYEFKSNGQEFKIKAQSETILSTDIVGSAEVAKNKAGDFYNPVDRTTFQISSSANALTTF